jgi:xanthine/uracil/vitamin C permease (AzgA family)
MPTIASFATSRHHIRNGSAATCAASIVGATNAAITTAMPLRTRPVMICSLNTGTTNMIGNRRGIT